MTADFVIISSWPNGVYLSRKLSEISNKVCYIDIQNSPHRPMGVFLEEGKGEERGFLESLGTLERQGGGFCLLSEEGVWRFQEEGSERLKSTGPFRHWLSCFASGFMAPVFESNYQGFFSPLNLYSDYFLFHPHLKRKARFQSSHSNIRWLSDPSNGNGIQIRGEKLFFSGEAFSLDKVMELGENALKITSPSSDSHLPPDWEWVSFDFSADLKNYRDVVPSHFVSINRLLFPWTHDNLLSVFHRGERFEVWCRQPFRAWDKKDEGELIFHIQVHIQKIFPGVSFQFLRKRSSAGLFVYGQNSFSGLEESLILQGNLMEQIRTEENIFKEVAGRS